MQARGKFRIVFISLFVSLLAFSACVTPPTVEKPSVIPQEEFNLLSKMTRGQEYALAGRMIYAELEFREVLEALPDFDKAYNNLGYSLGGQNRFEEARWALSKALELEPDNVVAREQLARNWFKQGDYEKALEEYEAVVEWFYQASYPSLREDIRRAFGTREMVSVYRNLSLINLLLGDIDQAKCYSRLAYGYSPSFTEIGRHTRLLLSLNEVEEAYQILQSTVSRVGAAIPPKLLADYGISLYATGRYDLAYQAALRVLAHPVADYEDSLTGRLLILAASEKRKGGMGTKELFGDFLEEDEDFCTRHIAKVQYYWPLVLVEDVEAMLRKLCESENGNSL